MQAGSADVLYSSHMIEHLNQTEMRLFLKEARRCLVSGGIIRLVVLISFSWFRTIWKQKMLISL